MRKLFGTVLVGAALLAAAPALAGDTRDTVDEKTHATKKTLRGLKPGDKTAGDRKEDAKDSVGETTAKTKKSVRHAGRSMKRSVHRATHPADDTHK